VELHSFDPTLEAVAATISKRYPAIFHVNREARFEAIQQSGGELVQISMNHKRGIVKHRLEPQSSKGFNIYINFHKDTFFISERFGGPEADPRNPWLCTLRRRIAAFITVLPVETILKITKLQLGCRTSDPLLAQNDCFGLGLLRASKLKKVLLVFNQSGSEAEFVLRQIKTAVRKT
jgi:hypothetical protein